MAARPGPTQQIHAVLATVAFLLLLDTSLLSQTLLPKGAEQWLVWNQAASWLATLRGRGGASNACFHS